MTELSTPNLVPVPHKKGTTMVFIANVLLAAAGTFVAALILPKLEFGGTFIFLAIASAIYLIPSYIAGSRGHQHMMPIFLVNMFLGSTILGWVGALVWAFMPVETRYERAPSSNQDHRPL